MLKHELLRDDGILVLKPDGALEAPISRRWRGNLIPTSRSGGIYAVF